MSPGAEANLYIVCRFYVIEQKHHAINHNALLNHIIDYWLTDQDIAELKEIGKDMGHEHLTKKHGFYGYETYYISSRLGISSRLVNLTFAKVISDLYHEYN